MDMAWVIQFGADTDLADVVSACMMHGSFNSPPTLILKILETRKQGSFNPPPVPMFADVESG